MNHQLLQAAFAAQRNAFAPYSKFTVGAAILSATGNIYAGCNVENASYGLSICAERAAVCALIHAGERKIDAIYVVSKGAVTPCGACRQVLSEFGSEFSVTLLDSDDGQAKAVHPISALLPHSFRLTE